IRRARVGPHRPVVGAMGEAGDRPRIVPRGEPGDEIQIGALALPDDPVVERGKALERPLGDRAHVRAAHRDDRPRHQCLHARRDAGRVGDRDGRRADAHVVGGRGRHRPRPVVHRRPGPLAVDDAHAVSRDTCDRGEREGPDAGNLLLAFAHAIHATVPAHVGRLDEHNRLRTHPRAYSASLAGRPGSLYGLAAATLQRLAMRRTPGGWAGLVLALVLGAAVRWTLPGRVEDLRPRPDALEYEEAARNLSEGAGYCPVFDGGCYPPRYPSGFSLLLTPAMWLSGGRHGAGIWVVMASALAASRPCGRSDW